MKNETLLRALQERMRKLTENGIDCAAKIAQLREKSEQARLGIETLTMQQSKAARGHEELVAEANALQIHVNDLLRGRTDPILISSLEDELKDLERHEREANQQIEGLQERARALGATLAAVKAELEASEETHRKMTDQSMKLREHIEKVAHA
jgi:chromosome segregation ATPase